MKPQAISKAALDRAVLAACRSVSPNPPPKWFREVMKVKIAAAIRSLGIRTKGGV